MRLLFCLGLFFGVNLLGAQDVPSNYRIKKVAVVDSIQIDSTSINPAVFEIKTKANILLDTSYYSVDFIRAILTFRKPIETDSIIINYLKYPNFFTKKYQQLSKDLIVANQSNLNKFYQINQEGDARNFVPFEGLNTSGSISRGVTIGNNQNSVLNSELDLQISGKLSDKVTLRASIQDANIPLQQSGYSQRLDEFDQVFIEIFSDTWNIRAGDIDLVNTNSHFANFTKRVQGLAVNFKLDHDESHTNVFASGALVRGQFTTSRFTAQEGNQGPYKLRGQNDQLFVLIVSGSETVYVNGVPLTRGENEDYIIDYNAGEIIFNSTFPITSEMRVTVDYQFSERNYSRFIVYGGSNYESEKLKLNATFYSESDAKNQPLQQNLSTEQIEILANAGNDTSQMVAPSAIAQDFSENRILYRKEIIDGEEIFVFSNNPNDELFSVRFTLVGENQGNYVLSNIQAISNIFEYVPPVNGVPQGNYEPVVQLIAPTRLQVAVVNGLYTPSEKTNVFFELAGSKNDRNLFSDIDNDDNDGFAAKLKLQQQLVKNDSLWNLSAIADADFIQKNFRTIERLYQAEFIRDWNLDNPIGNQLLFTSGLQLSHAKKGNAFYNFQHLNYLGSFNGNKHSLFADLRLGKFNIFSNSSYLNNTGVINSSTFFRTFNRVVYNMKNQYIGTKIAAEDNVQTQNATQLLTNLSQRFTSGEVFTGIGDSTGVFVEVGAIIRANDSLRDNNLKRVNTSETYYLKSRMIQNTKTTLQLFVNYRNLKARDVLAQDEQSLNSRLTYNQKLANNIILLNTIFETNAGTLPQQDFTYVEVEPGQGTYTWIDYNGNGIQELEEFEIAQFQDQASFIRVLLPNQVFVRTHQNRFSQSVTINPQQWNVSESKSKQFWSHFYNQTSFLIDRKTNREGNVLNLNPFSGDESDLLALNQSIRNVIFYNRGQQKYTTSYTFLSNASRSLLSVGIIENTVKSHQINFNHKFATSWLVTLQSTFDNNESSNENFSARDFELEELRLQPQLSYIFDENAQFNVFYNHVTKDNTIGNLETLVQNNYGASFTFNKADKIALTGEFNYFKNAFNGNANSPVAYQILEGLQPGNNFTWSLLAQRKLTKFLDLNLNYFGRKSESSRTIHTGTVQLRAYF